MNFKKVTFLLAAVLIVSLNNASFAQRYLAKFFPAAAVPSGGATNVNGLLTGYLSPLSEDFISISNNAWYSTPVVHKRWGFDFSIAVTTISAPAKTLSFPAPALSGVTYQGTAGLPTAYGEKGKFPSFVYTSGANSGVLFKGTDGAGITEENPLGSIAIPTAQFGIGVFKDTDLRLRFAPKTEVLTVAFSNWGVGVLHDFKRYIPAFITGEASLSAFIGYTQFNTEANLAGLYTGSGQEGISKTKAFTFQATAGKEFFKFLTLFAGVGLNMGSTSYNINGTFVVNETDSDEPLPAPITLTNPYAHQFSTSGFRSTAGMRLRGGPVFLNGDIAFVGGKRLLTAGLGVTIR